MRRTAFSLVSLLLLTACTQPLDLQKSTPPTWKIQQSGTETSLRGVYAVNEQIAWISGASGTFGRTTDGGQTWEIQQVSGAEELDFRDVEAFDENTAFLLSIGRGENSRIYFTDDGGANWILQYKNDLPEGFLDAMDFWDPLNGIAIGDPIEGKYLILTTSDGGTTWTRVSPERIPPALEGEAAFAASGTCLVVQGEEHAWLGTGGGPAGRVFFHPTEDKPGRYPKLLSLPETPHPESLHCRSLIPCTG